MKIRYLALFLVFTLLIGATSCKKGTEDIITTLVGKVTANIDGVAWEATTANQVGYKIGDNRMTILANSLGGQTIFLYINGTTVGTYDLALTSADVNTGCYFRESKDGAATTNYYSQTGTIKITEITDNRISGTFQFSAVKSLAEKKEITEGVFTNVYYTGKSQ